MLFQMRDVGPQLSEERLKEFERFVECELPADYRAFLLQHNGGRPSLHLVVDVGGLPGSPTDIQVFYGLDRPPPFEFYDLEWRFNECPGMIRTGWCAFANDSSGNLFCLSLSGEDRGAVYLHVLYPEIATRWYGAPKPEDRYEYLVAPTFSAFLAKIRPWGENILLVGLRGSGKTAVGRLIAAELGRDSVDTDEHIERETGQSITQIFAAIGEGGFRELEVKVLRKAIDGWRRVISVGGGAVLTEVNRTLIRIAGTCFWLTASPDELHRRCLADPSTAARRPALTALPEVEEFRQVLAFREPLYKAVADHVVDTTGRSPEEVARMVIALFPPTWLTEVS